MPEAAATAARALLTALLLVGLASAFLPRRRLAAGSIALLLLVAVTPSGLLALARRSAASALGLGLAVPLAALAPSWRGAAAGAAAIALALTGLEAGGWILLFVLPGALLAARGAGTGAMRAGLLLSAACGAALVATSWNGSLANPQWEPQAMPFLFPLPMIPADGSFMGALRESWEHALRLARGEDLLGGAGAPTPEGLFRFVRVWEILAPFLSTLAFGGALSLSAMTFLRPRGRPAPTPALLAAALLCLVYVLDLLSGVVSGGPSPHGAGRVAALPLLAVVLPVFGSGRRPGGRWRTSR